MYSSPISPAYGLLDRGLVCISPSTERSSTKHKEVIMTIQRDSSLYHPSTSSITVQFSNVSLMVFRDLFFLYQRTICNTLQSKCDSSVMSTEVHCCLEQWEQFELSCSL
ncbi:hypothetical protein AVEN_76996-1 [Araneus ventricosus]|uniref:Uncharacterized protein n=1 Tax=Araneus ventricosus TaxID=182803 RepID=A0A4Y2JFI8_ARAVE|nr:hypothetical protein AVEN_254724-1 [Araneus ventricosus]GBM88207.1 hypothetical protein AVEN_33795-1 [Araneus ventricosus]GBM88213.1 hypothetical protein AVEN_36234-1 [Araneus ventricosus]GBM88219.1 hypothetical protein AVEN_76996-1 [Araneus ventricosus]